MRYTGSVSNAFVQSMAHNFEQALRLMETALTDCPDELWQTDLWPDQAPTAATPHGGLHGSAAWFLGYHALNTLDYDLAGEFEPWAPPPPFDDNTYGFPNRRFTGPELVGYVDWCRGRVRQTLDGLTEEMAARPLPSATSWFGGLHDGRPAPARRAEHRRHAPVRAGERPERDSGGRKRREAPTTEPQAARRYS
jgi:hypothetical protein